MVPALAALRRLDLGHNSLASLPPLGALRTLQELFLNDNPLRELPAAALEGCFALRCLDVRRTRLRALPPALGRLPELIDVALAGAPLEGALLDAGRAGGTAGLLALLRARDERDGEPARASAPGRRSQAAWQGQWQESEKAKGRWKSAPTRFSNWCFFVLLLCCPC
jgi:hypothetical protein